MSVAFYIIPCEIIVQNKDNHLVPYMHIQTILHYCLFIYNIHSRSSGLLRSAVTNISVLQLNIQQEEILIDLQQNFFNPLSPELNPICYLLALLAHHFLQVSRIRVKSLTLRLLMSYIYLEHLFLMFLDHTQRRSTVGRTPLDEWSARRRDLYMTIHDTHNRQMSMPPVEFETTISVGERP
jgi:hypothetical protein